MGFFFRVCNRSPGNKCGDGRDGDAGCGWLSKSLQKQAQKMFPLDVQRCSHPQIIQTAGSYSFLLCGVTIACIAFILFMALLLVQRIHRNHLPGTNRLHPVAFTAPPPSLQLLSEPHQENPQDRPSQSRLRGWSAQILYLPSNLYVGFKRN